TRRIKGEYIMTEEDVLGGRQFPDAVAQGSYCIDIHNPAGTGTVIKCLPPGAHYDIPYRCLVPLGVDNLLVAGRPISTTHVAHSSTRIMPICMAVGQAAGTAAAMAAHLNKAPREINIAALQQLLRQQGALID
ncbi:MAG: FAD-dependent oxidoreductase, partial [bacterium]|nr:FAD-dependent oxidoreductase [bacterium]